MSAVEAFEPIGTDPEVLAALDALAELAAQVARRGGHELQTFCVVWCSEHDGDAFAGALVRGDASAEVIELMADTLADDSADVELPRPARRVN